MENNLNLIGLLNGQHIQIKVIKHITIYTIIYNTPPQVGD
jgi:hypothetical protein